MTHSEDAARLAKLVADARATRADQVPPDDIWPSIRDRIERGKVVTLPAPAAASARERARVRRSFMWVGAAVAAGLTFFVIGRASGRFTGAPRIEQPATVTVTNVADSAGAYAEQARILFNRLSLERSLLRPGALAAIERDLHVVDSAIAELDAAVARDPNNPVLRRLLVSSYREKVDILKRVGNAE
jgi:hypothetical protein